MRLRIGDFVHIHLRGRNVTTFKENKMESIREKNLTNIIPLPVEKVLFHFEWLQHFDDTEKVKFLFELFSATRKAQEQNDWQQVAGLVEEWKETANINADTYVVESIEQAEKEFAEGKGISWKELKKELNYGG